MTPRNRWRVGLRCAGLGCIVVALVGIRAMAHQRVSGGGLGFEVYASLASLAYLGPGVVLLVRRDWHVVGWLLCGLGLVIGVSFSSEVGVAATRDGDAWLVWVLDVCEGASWAVLVAALLVLFPDGLGPRTPRQARTGRVVLVIGAAVAALTAFTTEVGVSDAHGAVLPSPLPAAFVPRPVSEDGLLFVSWAIVLIALIGFVRRHRAARAAERRQYRWVLASMVSVVVGLLIGLIGSAFGYDGAWYAMLAAYAMVPVAFMIAILRHRLYEIDRVVSRTVTYSVVLAVLTVAYAAATALLTVVLSADGDLSVAASTLLVAGLSRPLLRRVRRAVDRRFNRSRFDADTEVERFSRGLRTLTDLDIVSAELGGAVAQLLQPAHVDLWIRPR